MPRIVAVVFKTILLSIVLGVVVIFGTYLYKVKSINQKVEGIMEPLQQSVMNNDYLPASDYEVYKGLLLYVQTTMNGTDENPFIRGISLNYTQEATNCMVSLPVNSTNASGVVVNRDVLHKKLDVPGSYGDVMVVQVKVYVAVPILGSTGSSSLLDQKFGTTTLTYTKYVPCLKYNAIEN